MVAKFQSLDLGSYLDGELDLDYFISNFNHWTLSNTQAILVTMWIGIYDW
jgi:hypothetical protein